MLGHGVNEVFLSIVNLHVALVLPSFEQVVESAAAVPVKLVESSVGVRLLERLLDVPEDVVGNLFEDSVSL